MTVEQHPTKPWHRAAAVFNQNIQSVLELLRFDQDIIATAVGGLRSAADELEERYQLHGAITMLRNRASILERVSESDSLRPKYATMFNQCVVLLVSYFDSGLHDVFRAGVSHALRSHADVPVKSANLQVSWRALEQAEDQRDRIFADLFVEQKNVSFQDMQSVVRAFKDALGVALDRSVHTDNAILGQAARHVIVHAGSVVDERMMRQVAGAGLRTIKRDIRVGQPLRFAPEEVVQIAESMSAYVAQTCAAMDCKMPESGSSPL